MTDSMAQPPRGRDSRFPEITTDLVRRVSRPHLGAGADAAEVQLPEQGVNNRTVFVRPKAGPRLVVKFRPRSGKGKRRAGPQWPRYTRELFGPWPNGDLDTLPAVCRLLARHGTLRIPRVVAFDDSLAVVPAPYIISEHLTGDTFDWISPPLEGRASADLGEHLGALHRGTGNREGFGIFDAPEAFPRAEWWPRFGRAYRAILNELARWSPRMAALRPGLLAALRRAVSAGEPDSFALVCIDQSPRHYLRAADGGIAAMVDVEAHLWAPPEYELSMALIWLRDAARFRRAYEREAPWPRAMDRVRDAYVFMTWMEWVYCARTLLRDEGGADASERQLEALCRGAHPAQGDAGP